MAAYIAMRTEKRYKNEGVQSAKNYYNAIFAIQLYQQFKEEVDGILVADGYGDVVTE